MTMTSLAPNELWPCSQTETSSHAYYSASCSPHSFLKRSSHRTVQFALRFFCELQLLTRPYTTACYKYWFSKTQHDTRSNKKPFTLLSLLSSTHTAYCTLSPKQNPRESCIAVESQEWTLHYRFLYTSFLSTTSITAKRQSCSTFVPGF